MSYEINTPVVKAIMNLRGLTVHAVASALQIRAADLNAWLLEEPNHNVAYDRQLEVLELLGIRGETLRGDIVHYWTVREPVFGSVDSVYASLRVLTEAFGDAVAVFLAPEQEPAMSLTAKTHYGLKFPGFYAVLEIQANPLCNFKFNADDMRGISWMEGSVGILLESAKYAALEPGAVSPADFSEQVTSVQTTLKWERLTELARDAKVSPEQLAAFLRAMPAQLEQSPNPAASFTPAATAAPAETRATQGGAAKSFSFVGSA